MWYNKTSKEVIKELGVNPLDGLDDEEVLIRREKYGFNLLSTKKQKSIFRLFFRQLNDALIYILLAAALVSGALGEISDAAIIAFVIILNAVIGVVQEAKAEKALDALKKLSTPKAVVKRNCVLKEIPSEELVPGDVVIIDAGRYIPCDLRLIETANLKIEESALTGESVAVDKDADLVISDEDTALGDQRNMAFMSTLSTYGRSIGVAVATGMDTEIGKIARMLESDERDLTPLQKKLAELGKTLGIAALVICSLMFGVAIFQKRDILEMFLTAISLAVAAVPEGLPAIVTIVLAIGVQKMIKENAIIRKLPAVETLGAVNIICSDKTGTMTQNKMTVTRFYADKTLDKIEYLDKHNPVHNLLLENLMLCNDATYDEDSKTGDPTEIALLEAGSKYNMYKSPLEQHHARVDEIPFDSGRKLMSTINGYQDKYYVMTKGALDNLIHLTDKIYLNGEIASLSDEMKQEIIASSNSMTKDALRVLGAAYKILDSRHVELDEVAEVILTDQVMASRVFKTLEL